MPLRTDAFTADTAPGPALKQTSEKTLKNLSLLCPGTDSANPGGQTGLSRTHKTHGLNAKSSPFVAIFISTLKTHTKKLPRGLPPAAHKGELYFSNTASPTIAPTRTRHPHKSPRGKRIEHILVAFFYQMGRVDEFRLNRGQFPDVTRTNFFRRLVKWTRNYKKKSCFLFFFLLEIW